ncbi:bifunctional phosphoribosyl-AMP cyclohydrolase/phosphoribosyl-ATP diphosphatase HisIE [Francisellaceae bacterium]|nr:bifunctional phosphoribosyl-AMP cyclohydrolase/phosphoribosyl-ATP diphosphatase HisIE [Francisellaceae bacterium]
MSKSLSYSIEIEKLDWQKMDGLLPAIMQKHDTGEVLMLGYMNHEALQQTIDSGFVTFFSRSKNRLWVKGESSGHKLKVMNISYDCDGDALLVLAEPSGPTCHLGTTSCFSKSYEMPYKMLSKLEKVISQRNKDRPENSYVTSLFESGVARIAQKVGEEAVESVIAAMKDDQEELKNEMADLVFHALVLLREKGLSLSEVLSVLEHRA